MPLFSFGPRPFFETDDGVFFQDAVKSGCFDKALHLLDSAHYDGDDALDTLVKRLDSSSIESASAVLTSRFRDRCIFLGAGSRIGNALNRDRQSLQTVCDIVGLVPPSSLRDKLLLDLVNVVFAVPTMPSVSDFKVFVRLLHMFEHVPSTINLGTVVSCAPSCGIREAESILDCMSLVASRENLMSLHSIFPIWVSKFTAEIEIECGVSVVGRLHEFADKHGCAKGHDFDDIINDKDASDIDVKVMSTFTTSILRCFDGFGIQSARLLEIAFQALDIGFRRVAVYWVVARGGCEAVTSAIVTGLVSEACLDDDVALCELCARAILKFRGGQWHGMLIECMASELKASRPEKTRYISLLCSLMSQFISHNPQLVDLVRLQAIGICFQLIESGTAASLSAVSLAIRFAESDRLRLCFSNYGSVVSRLLSNRSLLKPVLSVLTRYLCCCSGSDEKTAVAVMRAVWVGIVGSESEVILRILESFRQLLCEVDSVRGSQRIQRIIFADGGFIHFIQSREAICNSMAESISMTYVACARGCPEVISLTHSLSENLLSPFLSKCGTETGVRACFRFSTLEPQVCVVAVDMFFMNQLVKTMVGNILFPVFIVMLRDVLRRSVFFRYQLSSSESMSLLIEHYFASFVDASLAECLALGLGEFAHPVHIKRLLLGVMREPRHRLGLSGSILGVIRSACSAKPLADFQYFALSPPEYGHSGVKVRVPMKSFEPGVTIRFSIFVIPGGSQVYTIVELRGFESSRKGDGFLLLSLEGARLSLKFDGRESSCAFANPDGASWRKVALHILPSRLVTQGRVSVEFEGGVLETPLPVIGTTMFLQFGSSSSIFGGREMRGFLSPITFSLSTDPSHSSSVIPVSSLPGKVLVVGKRGIRASAIGMTQVGECRSFSEGSRCLGPLQSIFIPLLMLSCKDTLPFSPDSIFELVSAGSPSAFQCISDVCAASALLVPSSPDICAESVSTGYFSLLAGLISAVAPSLPLDVTEDVVTMCSRLLPSVAVTDEAVGCLLLNRSCLQRLSSSGRATFLARFLEISQAAVLRSRLRACGLFSFIGECIWDFLEPNDAGTRESLLRLVDLHLGDRLGGDEAQDLVGLISQALRPNRCISLELMGLCQSCLTRRALLDSFYSTDLEAVIVGLMDRPETDVRTEALRLFILYVGQMKHSERSLSFLAAKMLRHGFSFEMYAVITESCARLPSSRRKRWLLNWPSLILPVLILAEEASFELRREVLSDLDCVLEGESAIAWASIVRLPCWYIHLIDLILADSDLLDYRPIVGMFSKALRAYSFYGQELKRALAYLTLRKAGELKSLLIGLLLKDAMHVDPTASLMRHNTHMLLSEVECYISRDTPNAMVIANYLDLFSREDNLIRVFSEAGFTPVVSVFLNACLRAPQLGISGGVVFSSIQSFVIAVRKHYQTGPVWLSVAARYRSSVMASAYVLAVSRFYDELEGLCSHHAQACGVRVRVTQSFLEVSGPRFISECKNAFDSLPQQRDCDEEEAIGTLHTLMSSSNLEKDCILKGYSETLASIEPSGIHRVLPRAMEEVWSLFLKRSSETIWRAPQTAVRYLRQLPREQTTLRMIKLVRDPKGTDHADVSTRTDLKRQEARRVQQLQGDVEVDEIQDLEMSSDDDQSDELLSCTTPCEYVHFIHCYSAEVRLSESRIEIVLSDENSAYNQTVSKAAQRYVSRPSKMSWPLGELVSVSAGRRYRMQRSALEFHFQDLSTSLVGFSYDNYRFILTRLRRLGIAVVDPDKQQEQLRRKRMTERWRVGELSNFEYLMELNYWAGRSTQDLSQYPVFPWILSDYTSKELDLRNPNIFRDLRFPIGWTGASSRADELEMRFKEMQCHYFQHYSSPAVVLYYLLRLEPYTTMHIIFQGGRFDHADRLFHSVASSWTGVRQNLQDVKEMIPEFYYLPEAFQNHNGVFLGRRQDGAAINFLDLPPWANSSPYEFVYRMREALESEVVSSSIHHWIDLIFGFKQRGEDAIRACNVFHPDTYEPRLGRKEIHIDVEVINSVDTVGQVPMQLFRKPHIERSVDFYLPGWSELSATYLAVVRPERDGHVVTAMAVVESQLFVLRADGRVIVYSVESTPLTGKVKRFRQITKSFDVFGSEGQTIASPLDGVVQGSVRNSAIVPLGGAVFSLHGGMLSPLLAIRCLTPEKMLQGDRDPIRFFPSHFDRISRISVAEDGMSLVTVGSDTLLSVWSLDGGLARVRSIIRSHPGEVLDAACSTTMDMVASSSINGSLLIHSLLGELQWSDIHPQLGRFDIVRLVPSCYIPHLLVHSRSDSATRQYSVNGVLLRVLTHERYLIDIFPLPGSRQNTLFSCSGRVVLHHSFLFDTILTHDVDDDIVAVATHPRNPQALILASISGSINLLRAEAVESPR